MKAFSMTFIQLEDESVPAAKETTQLVSKARTKEGVLKGKRQPPTHTLDCLGLGEMVDTTPGPQPDHSSQCEETLPSQQLFISFSCFLK